MRILLLLCSIVFLPAVAGATESNGVLSGTVTFEGELPEDYSFDLTVKPEHLKVCSGGKGNLKPARRLRVAEKGRGLEMVVVRLAPADGQRFVARKPFPLKHRPLVDQVHCEFVPFVTWVEAGQSLRLRSSDEVMHNVHAYKERYGGETLFNLAMPDKDRVVTKKMEDAGLVCLGCDSGHLWMSAYVFVVEDPYIEITAADGRFSMDGIPPGSYKVSFWQAGWEVTPGAPDLQTGKPRGYAYSEPLLLERIVEIKAGENTLDAVLTKDGWKK